MKFASFKEFYPYYLNEHRNRTCKILHFIGTSLVITCVWMAITNGNWGLLKFVPLVGYGFAWIGHFQFEKNRPATFKHPLYSLRADFVMFWHLLSGKLSFNSNAKLKA